MVKNSFVDESIDFLDAIESLEERYVKDIMDKLDIELTSKQIKNLSLLLSLFALELVVIMEKDFSEDY